MLLRRRARSGFSLLEVFTAMCILWLLMTAWLTFVKDRHRDAQLTVCTANLKLLMAAREMYAVDNQNAPLALAWPPTGPQAVTKPLRGAGEEKRALLRYLRQASDADAFTCPSSRTEGYELVETCSTSYLGGTIRCTEGRHEGCAPGYPQIVEGSGQRVQYRP